jgi:hypothetical protein
VATASRSRPFVADWTGDGLPDVLIGAGEGKAHLFQNVLGDLDCSGVVDMDGVVSGLDIEGFVEAMLGG